MKKSKEKESGSLRKPIKVTGILLGGLIVLLIVFLLIPANSEEIYEVPVSDEDVHITSEKGIEVKIPPYMVQEDTKLAISSSKKKHIEVPDSEDKILNSVEIKLGDKEELNGVLEVKIPYDKSRLDGNDPEKVLYVVTEDPQTGKHEYVLTDVDDGYITAYTDHLSYYDLYFDSYKKDTAYEEKLRKAGIYFNRESLEAHFESLKSNTNAEESAAKMGWEAFNSGLGISGDYASILQLAKSSSQMDTFLTGFTSLGNVAFYLGIAQDAVQGLEKGDYSALKDNLAEGIIGFGIANFANPGIQAAYAAVKLTHYYGGKLASYVEGEAYKKFDAAYEKVYENAVIEEFKQKEPKTVKWQTHYEIHWFNKILDIYNRVDKDNFDTAVKEAITEEVKTPLSENYRDDLNMYLSEYVQEEQSEDYWFFKSYNLRAGEDLDKFIDMKVAEKMKELQPVFQRITNYLVFKAEKEYYQKYMKIKERYEAPRTLTFKINGENVEKYDINIEFYKNGKTLDAFNTGGAREIEHEMSMRDYVEMGLPDTVRMMVIKEDAVDEYRKDFSFEFDDQTIEFTLKPEPAPTKETEPVEEESAPAIEEPSAPDEEEPVPKHEPVPATGEVIGYAEGKMPVRMVPDALRENLYGNYFYFEIYSSPEKQTGSIMGVFGITFQDNSPEDPEVWTEEISIGGILDGLYTQGEGLPKLEGTWLAERGVRNIYLSGDEKSETEESTGNWVAEVDSSGNIRLNLMGIEELAGFDMALEGYIQLR